MSKSKGGSSDGRDLRKHNSPPEHGKIKPQEVRNPWGRAGKPSSAPPTTMDELLWQEASRVVSQDHDGPVDAKRRLIQEEFRAALRDGDGSVRARLLAQLHETGARIEQQQSKILTFFIEGKAHLTEQFDLAKKLGQPPPDVVPHPDHVVVDDHVHFFGPADRRGRAAWEELKAAIRVAACLHDIVRSEYRRTGCPVVLEELRAAEKHRRWLMRFVPKGWNWREEIYCRDSKLAFAKEIVSALKEMGYVSPDDID
jgi:hypothetical protein